MSEPCGEERGSGFLFTKTWAGLQLSGVGLVDLTKLEFQSHHQYFPLSPKFLLEIPVFWDVLLITMGSRILPIRKQKPHKNNLLLGISP